MSGSSEPRSADKLIATLDSLLEEERAALVAGDLRQLETFLQKKSEVIELLNTTPDLEAAQLATVQAKVRRNQSLLGGALDGIRSVADRMAEMRRVRAGLDTYDRSGRRTSLSAPKKPKVERRA
ncbi:flagellar biosynthesis protein FlgN [Chachezhania sediminis]|uniref:flagellar biosynthesis protein FlgN n=1 Tax=Chachezhania sediminis TaxID=2599291 RepID=UPI00131D10E9|nr:flagellar biosynthesis protein FlgN [Chachezhania sediminis]